MYDHIGLRVGDLDASVRFYTAALAPLGFVLCSRDDSGAGFGPKGEPALWLHLHKGNGRHRRACRVPRQGSRRDQEIPCRGPEGRRPRQWRRRAARGLQPDLLRRVPDRPRRQQCRGGLHVAPLAPPSLRGRCEAIEANPHPSRLLHAMDGASLTHRRNDDIHSCNKDLSHGFHPERNHHRRHRPTTSGTRCAISARCIRGWCRAS